MISLERVISDTQALIRVDSQNPGTQELRCSEWVGNRLAEAGLDPKYQEVLPGSSNIVATLRGSGDAPRLVLLAHMDTVPIGEGWSYPPLGAVIEDGRLYGRGACDMKGGLAVAINLLDEMQRRRKSLRGDLVLVSTVDEEAPEMLGAHHLVGGDFFRPDDQVLALEPTGLRLRLAQMGLRWLDVQVTGRMAHAGRAHLGIDSVHVLSRLVDRLKVEVEEIPHTDEILGRARFTCGRFHGGVATNVVPPSAQASFDIRIVPPMSTDDVYGMVRSAADAVLADFPGAAIDIVPLGASRPPVRASDSSMIVTSLRSAYQAATGQSLPQGGADGHEAYTDASMVASLTGSTSCTVFGPGSTDQAHTADEFVSLKDLDIAARTMWALADSW